MPLAHVFVIIIPLPISRNVKTSKDTSQPRGGRRGGRGNGAGSGRGRGGGGGGSSTLIQTQGLFSEGAGDGHLRRSTGNGSAYARAGDEVAVARKRADRKDDKAQALRVKELIGESDVSDVDDPSDEDVNKTEMALRPILLKEGKNFIPQNSNKYFLLLCINRSLEHPKTTYCKTGG